MTRAWQAKPSSAYMRTRAYGDGIPWVVVLCGSLLALHAMNPSVTGSYREVALPSEFTSVDPSSVDVRVLLMASDGVNAVCLV